MAIIFGKSFGLNNISHPENTYFKALSEKSKNQGLGVGSVK